MKKYFAYFALIATSIFVGCTKDAPQTKPANLTDAQAVSMIANSLALNSNGLTSIKNDITLYALNVQSNGCGIIDSFALAKQWTPQSPINYNYALGYNYKVNCNNSVLNNLNSNITYNGSFDASTLSVVNTGASAITVSSLDNTISTFTLTGTYQSQDAFQLNDGSSLAGNASIVITVQSLIVDKATKSIMNGAADVLLTGTLKTHKKPFSFSANVVFKNDGTAVIILNGVSYGADLTTGEVFDI